MAARPKRMLNITRDTGRLIIVTLITMKIADWIIDSRIGALDRTLGFLYGAARGILVVAVGLLFFNWLVGVNTPAWIANAKSRPLLESIGATLEGLLPDDPENSILKRLSPGEPEAEQGAPAADAPATQQAPAGTAPSEIAPDEMIRYETQIAPEVQAGVGMAIIRNNRRRLRAEDGPYGRGTQALLYIPQPVISADADFNRGVSLAEFRHTAGQRFLLIDRNHDGRLSRDELSPPTEDNRRR